MKKVLILLMLLGMFLWSSINIKAQIHEYSIEVQRMQIEVEMLRLEQQELIKQVRNFVDKWNIAIMEATAYAPIDNKSGVCADDNPLLTATGARPGPGTIAVNPKVIPYQSQMWVQGYGWGKALDTGGIIRARDDLIDVYQDTYSEAIKWGRRKVVVIWSPGPTEY
jgi:3D (Asp-Asp-Asp) domain-containing protein